MKTHPTSNKKTARKAGLLYLSIVITGIFSLMYVPSKLIIWDNAAATFNNVIVQESLFRFGIVSGLLCYTCFLFLPLVLYRLLSPVNENYAKFMVLLAAVSVPMFFINAQNQFNILSLVNNDIKISSVEETQSQVLLYFNQYNNGLRLIHIFSGLWLFPFGYLVFKSDFLPKVLGILLILGCFGYLINFLGNTLFPMYSKLGVSTYVSLPASIGEIGICLWFLIVGVKEKNAGKTEF